VTKIKKIEKKTFFYSSVGKVRVCGGGGECRRFALIIGVEPCCIVYTQSVPRAAGSICHVAAGYCVHAAVKATVLSGGVSFNDSTTPSPTGVNPAEDAGDTSPSILVGGTLTGISPQYYYVLSYIADQYWLPSVRSASSRFRSAIRRHQFASVRQAGGQSAHKARPPPPRNLELALTPLPSPTLALLSLSLSLFGNQAVHSHSPCCRCRFADLFSEEGNI